MMVLQVHQEQVEQTEQVALQEQVAKMVLMELPDHQEQVEQTEQVVPQEQAE